MAMPALADNSKQASSPPSEPSENTVMGYPGQFQLGLAYSDQFGPVIDTEWINFLTPKNSFAFSVNAGGREFYLGGTWGSAFAQSQRFKLTAEHLAQNFDFDYASGDDIQWLGQNAFGGSYQYLFKNYNSWLKSINAGAFYADAETETLSPKAFTNSSGTFTNIRDLAGAKTEGVIVGVDIAPLQMTLIEINLNYDDVRYPTNFEKAKNSSGLGATLNLQQLINDHFKVDFLASDRQPFNQYQADAYWVLHTRPGTRLVLGLVGYHLSGDIPTATENRIILNMAYSWGGDPNSYPSGFVLPDQGDANDLSAWTSQSAVPLPAVLVMRDQLVR